MATAKHGGRGRRGWRKLHLGVDQSGAILVHTLTEATGDDATTVQRLTYITATHTRQLDAAALAAYLSEIHDAGRAASSAAMAVGAAQFRVRLAGQHPGGPCVGRGAAGRRACRIGRWAVAERHLRRDWKGRDFLVLGVCIQIVSERFKCAYVAADNGSGTFEAVVIPSPPVADLESLVATLNAVPDIPLAVVSALSYVHLGSDAKGSNSRHRRPPVLRARRYW